ncbi:MAG: hypothetical protein KGH58_04690, partial [Candidatus Micrarchaeota archaeon]|nr:hypothetical protein [Candidatus Micrarchaeota archaeon]
FRLRGGHSAEVPIYSRSEGRAVGTRTVGPADTVICEGFLLFYHSHIRHLFDLRIAIQLGKAQQFERRLARQPEVDQHYLKNVIIPTCKRFMRAQSRRSHHVLDGTMELPALREEVAGLVSAAREARLRSLSKV